MFIETETTPNPATLKFLPGRPVMARGTANFTDSGAAARSPLAAQLFALPDVAGVFLGSDFVSVTKLGSADWAGLKTEILGTLVRFFLSGAPVIAEGDVSSAEDGADDGVVGRIRELLETRVRPAVAQDGGDIIFHDFADGVVYLHMQGACSGCPSSTATLKAGIENLLRHYIPEVREVRAV